MTKSYDIETEFTINPGIIDGSIKPDFDIKTGIIDGSAPKGLIGYYFAEGTVITTYGESYNSDPYLIKGEKVTGEEALAEYLRAMESGPSYIRGEND
jgi:hypothetical protein